MKVYTLNSCFVFFYIIIPTYFSDYVTFILHVWTEQADEFVDTSLYLQTVIHTPSSVIDERTCSTARTSSSYMVRAIRTASRDPAKNATFLATTVSRGERKQFIYLDAAWVKQVYRERIKTRRIRRHIQPLTLLTLDVSMQLVSWPCSLCWGVTWAHGPTH